MDSALEALRATTAARRYYVDGATKSAIAGELRVSRFKVARLIDRAVKDGIITFTVREPAGVQVESSLRLAVHLGIPECVVVPTAAGTPERRRAELGAAAARIVAGLLEDGQRLGITWGRTLRAVVDALPELPKVDVVQLVGGLAQEPLASSPADLVRAVGARTAGRAWVLHAPLLADTPGSARTLRAETSIAATLALYGGTDRAVVGIGSWHGDGSGLRSALPAAVQTACDDAGVVADIGTTLFAQDGTVLEVPGLSDRAISVTTEELRSIPDVTAVAVGEDRADAVRAACRSGIVHRLVTDHRTAEALLG